MLALAHAEERYVDVPPEAVFAIVGDVASHATLAGSGEVKSVRVLTDGPIRVGTEFEADEEIKFGPSMQRFVAQSVIRDYVPGRVISWTSVPPGRPQPRRIQWWYELEPEGPGTRVRERVEVDMGPISNVVLKPIYLLLRAGAIKTGMARTLDNLARRLTEQH